MFHLVFSLVMAKPYMFSRTAIAQMNRATGTIISCVIASVFLATIRALKRWLLPKLTSTLEKMLNLEHYLVHLSFS